MRPPHWNIAAVQAFPFCYPSPRYAPVISPVFRPPVQPEFHPEFGYLWPAANTRRMMRIGLFATAFGAMVGAIAAIGMTHRPDPDAQRAQTALAVETPPTVGAAPATTAAAAVTAGTPT